MVNIHNKRESFKFLEDLNLNINQHNPENTNSNAVKIVSSQELEAIIGIVKVHGNFFIQPFKYDNNKDGFEIYNNNDKAAIASNNPILKLTQDNIGLGRYRLHNVAMSEDNLLKASTIAGLNTRDQYYTRTGMPKRYRGMTLKE